MNEPTFTAEPWRHFTAVQECTVYRHDFDFFVNRAGDLVGIRCERECGKRWKVEEIA